MHLITQLRGKPQIPKQHIQISGSESRGIGYWRKLDIAEVIQARDYQFGRKPAAAFSFNAVSKVGLLVLGIGKILLKKYYIDELYDAVFVRPLVWVSDRILWRGIDAGAIDGAGVNGSAGLARALGSIGSWLQSGSVGTYVFIFVIGVVIILRSVAGS